MTGPPLIQVSTSATTALIVVNDSAAIAHYRKKIDLR